jgi:hypothetical protein
MAASISAKIMKWQRRAVNNIKTAKKETGENENGNMKSVMAAWRRRQPSGVNNGIRMNENNEKHQYQ